MRPAPRGGPSTQPGGRVHTEPVVDPSSGAVIVVSRVASGPVLRVLDALTGAQRWGPPGRLADRRTGRHAVAVSSSQRGDGHFHALVLTRPRNGVGPGVSQVRASFEVGIVPAADADALVVIDHYGHVTALDRHVVGLRIYQPFSPTVPRPRVFSSAARTSRLSAVRCRLDRRVGRVAPPRPREVDGWAVDVPDPRPLPGRRPSVDRPAIRLGGAHAHVASATG